MTTYTDSFSDTIYLTGYLIESAVAVRNIAMFIADTSGNIYEYDDQFKGDAGVAIVAHDVTKRLDFSDMYPADINKWKTIYGAKLIYVDKSASSTVTFGYSLDGGVSWTEESATIGVGDGTIKEHDFFMVATGRHFTFRLENDSASDDFQWIELWIDYEPMGDYWSVG